ncbi:MAG: hypothetical protein ACLT23_11130, partial [Lachnospiraceae bacterium]
MRPKYSAKRNLQLAEIIFQTLSFINDFSFTYIIVKTPVRS